MNMKTTIATVRRATTTKVLGRTAAAGLALAMLVSAAGCNSLYNHGQYTSEHKSGAKAKMQALKSASEYQMAHQAYLSGDLEKALKHADYAIELNEKVVKSHVLRGRILLEMSDIEKASQAFANAEGLDANNVDVWYFQGILNERIGKTEEALRRYMGAAERDPSNAQYVIATTEMLMQLDHLDEAAAFIEARADTFEHSAGVQQVLGHIAMLKDRKSTRLNSSHLGISYAVFCLKKKK